MNKGLIHIYTGDGKGKTTAAVGISVRAVSRGLRVLFAQFFKEEDPGSEVGFLKRTGVRTLVFDSVKSPYFNPDIDREYLKTETLKALGALQDILAKEQFDLMVLDEFICLMAEDILSEESAIAFLQSRPSWLEIVLTGQGATDRIMDHADYVTFMKNIKHPFKRDTPARRGIDY